MLEPRTRLRGRLHLAAAVASAAGLVWLVASADGWQARIAAWVYGLAALLLYATSSTYHVFARSPRARRLLQRADHSMINVLIAGTFTPICLLAMEGWFRWVLLGVVWTGAVLAGIATLVALERFHKLVFANYIVLGWIGLTAIPALIDRPVTLLLVFLAGVLYTVGAVLFGLHRPRWQSQWFGYHEVWHSFGVAAGALFFAVNLGLIRNAGG